MAGRGPAPKPAERRARRNADVIQLRVIHADPTEQPDLPDVEIEQDGQLIEFTWPARTQAWWAMWRDSPLSAEFTGADWDFLLDTALIHARMWSGHSSLAAELRLRVAKFGQTPEDRARLRITFAQADEAEERRGPKAPSARDRRVGLKSIPPSG